MQSTLVKRRTTAALPQECPTQSPNKRALKQKPVTIITTSNSSSDCKVKIVLSPIPSIKNDSTRCSTISGAGCSGENNPDEEYKSQSGLEGVAVLIRGGQTAASLLDQ